MRDRYVHRREFLNTVGLGTGALACPGLARSAGSAEQRKTRPNVLILFTDDQRFDTIHALDCPDIETPNMDRLVRNGVTFTRAHIMGSMSGAVCMPSRAMLMTGRTLFHLQEEGGTIAAEHVMIPELFRDTGYTTFGTGKWHNGRHAYARAFTHGGKIMFGGMSDHLKVPVYDFDPDGVYPKKKQYVGEKFSSVMFSDEAVRFLEHEAGDNPFFMYVSYTAPHDPRMAPREFAELYPPERVKLPENFMPEHPFDTGEMKIRDEALAPRPRTPEVVREHIAAYYAMISHVDAEIGRVLDALERSGKADNTVIVFASDNGLAIGSHGLMGKQNLYQHSVRVPLIVTGPGIPKGVKADGLCYLLDLFPTLCELAGLPIPETVEGRSVVPMLRDPEAKLRNSLFFAYKRFQRAVLTDYNLKLIGYNVKGKQTIQLFDLARDPHELTNLAEDDAYAGRVRALTDLLKTLMADLDDPCDFDADVMDGGTSG